MSTTLTIDYYTDILCVWAWIAQRRVDELLREMPGQVEFNHYYVDVFGSVEAKMSTAWQSRGGIEGFAEHVQESASQFDDIEINPRIWTQVRPATSANAHLILKAVSATEGPQASAEFALTIRHAFFIDARDVGDLRELMALAESSDLDTRAVNRCIETGTAMASLMHDYQQAKAHNIKGSPSYVMDGGRQTLYGNVGYRVLRANVEELLKNPQDEASWC